MKRKWILLSLLLIFVAGCASTATLSPKGKAAMILATYNAQAEQTVLLSKRPDLTENQKIIVRQKKAIIQKLDPLVKHYGLLVQTGGIPPVEDEKAIYDLIDDLVALTP